MVEFIAVLRSETKLKYIICWRSIYVCYSRHSQRCDACYIFFACLPIYSPLNYYPINSILSLFHMHVWDERWWIPKESQKIIIIKIKKIFCRKLCVGFRREIEVMYWQRKGPGKMCENEREREANTEWVRNMENIMHTSFSVLVPNFCFVLKRSWVYRWRIVYSRILLYDNRYYWEPLQIYFILHYYIYICICVMMIMLTLSFYYCYVVVRLFSLLSLPFNIQFFSLLLSNANILSS